MSAPALAPMAPSPLASSIDNYVAAGFSPIPCWPRDKAPGGFWGGRWQDLGNWTRFRQHPAPPVVVHRWKTWPDANIGILLGTRVGDRILVGVDIDADDENIAERLAAALPPSPMTKIGKKGETRFFLASPKIPSCQFRAPRQMVGEKNENGPLLAEFLAVGRQTVMPPSIHPDTGRPYTMVGRVVPIHALPVLDDDAIERFLDTLESCGWERQPLQSSVTKRPALPVFEDDPVGFVTARVNNRALADLSWVERLESLHRVRRKRNGYEAVPLFRPSRRNRDPNVRKRNLSITPGGITDFGTGKGYSPITLVQSAKRCSFDDAFGWLNRETGLEEESNIVPLHVLNELEEYTRQKRLARIAEQEAHAAMRRAEREAEERAAMDAWRRHGEPAPGGRPSWLIKRFLPDHGVALLAGASQAGKTFLAIQLAVSLATGTPFFAKPIRKRVGTALLLGEGVGTIEQRLDAALRAPAFAGCDDLSSLPISWREANLATVAHRQTIVAALKAEDERMRAQHGVGLGVVVVDTLAACLGLEDENAASEVTKAMMALAAIATDLGCLVIGVAHYGKTEATGVRGSSAFTASADVILAAVAEQDSLGGVQKRTLALTKTRYGETGWRADFELQAVQVGVDEDGDAEFSCYIEAEAGERIVTIPRDERLPTSQRAYVAAFDAVFSHAVDIKPFGEDGPIVKAIDRDRVREEFFASYPVEGDTEEKRRQAKSAAFHRAESGLRTKGKIVARQVGLVTFVWRINTTP